MKKLDFHVHVYGDIPVSESVRYLNDMCERFGYSGIGVMALWHNSRGYHPECNEKSLAIKNAMPGSYAFAGLDYNRNFVEQTKEYMENGFDGIKLLAGKPSEYRHFGYGYEHPRFYEFFEYAQKHEIPVMIHNNDPIGNWDITKVTKSIIAKGWFYDEKMPRQKFFFDVLDEVFVNFPNLRAAIAHMGFYSENMLDKADRMLESYKNLYFDITPALNTYYEMNETHDQAQAFFEKNHDRLVFGTDAIDHLVSHDREYNIKKNAVTDAFLQGKENDFSRKDKIVPLNLTEEMLENIYYNNALRFMKKL